MLSEGNRVISSKQALLGKQRQVTRLDHLVESLPKIPTCSWFSTNKMGLDDEQQVTMGQVGVIFAAQG